MPEVIVVGSLNIDLVVQVPRFPAPGETITGGDLQRYPGGKGANQAVAAAKHQISTAMIGKVGDDPYGEELLENLEHHQIDTTRVLREPDTPTGSALISITPEGENSIIVSPGANARLRAEDLQQAEELIAGASLMLLQLEVPLTTIAHAVRLGKKHGLRIILNPAPAVELPASVLEEIDILVPNQSELALLSGMEIDSIQAVETAAGALLDAGIPALIVTLGAEGAYLASEHAKAHLPSIDIRVVDSTAAGDAFIGGLAAAVIQGKSLDDAVQYANIAGALAVTKKGAQPSLPTAAEVKAVLQSTQTSL